MRLSSMLVFCCLGARKLQDHENLLTDFQTQQPRAQIMTPEFFSDNISDIDGLFNEQ